MDMPILNLSQDGAIARLTLHRPEVHNALNGALIKALTEAFDALKTDDNVRVIVLAGEGKSLCAGADIDEMKTSGQKSIDENLADARRLAKLFETINFCPKPVVILAKGAVMGGGVGLIACADIVIADMQTKLALSEVRLGIIPAVISPFVLAKIGQSQARHLFLTAERFCAQRALEIGLVHKVCEDVEKEAQTVVDSLLAGGPLAQADAKQLIFDVNQKPIDFHLTNLTAARIAARRASVEGREGFEAFLTKRPPHWQV